MVEIGDDIRNLRDEDFTSILNYYNDYSINSDLLQNLNLLLLKRMHKFIYNYNLFISKLDINDHYQPYILQLKSNSIMLLNTCALGDVLGLKLNERLLIENLFRYIFYYHHEIEHHLLQIEPSQFITFTELFKYVKKYPKFHCVEELIHLSADYLKDKHAQLSRYVHTSTIEHMALVEDIVSINQPINDIQQEINNFNGIAQHTFFLTINFHIDAFNNLTLGERIITTEFLSDEQKRGITGII